MVHDAMVVRFRNKPIVSSLLLDFKSAAKNGFLQVFPAIEVKGCNFHFRQTLMHKVNDGLRSEYQNKAESAIIHPQILRFVQYFEFFWLHQVNNWNHFENDGPRNTNIAEAWHSKLNRSFGHPHPALQVFLCWLQREHYSQQKRIRQLQSGQPAKAPNATYAPLHEQIQTAKANLQQHLLWIQNQ